MEPPNTNLTDKSFWTSYHDSVGNANLSMPSTRSVFNLDWQRLMRQHVCPGMKVLEIGFAPGRQLAWAAKVLQADVAGVDNSPEGMKQARKLFAKFGLSADLREEDIFNTSFEKAQFDLVYSTGVIEHWDDPADIVKKHVELTRVGGTALLSIPNYTNLYGTIKAHFDPEYTKYHNLSIMNEQSLRALAPMSLCETVRVYPYGRIGSWGLGLHNKWPRWAVYLAGGFLNLLGFMQPGCLPGMNTLWILEMKRK